jgi:hypothetical protein
VNPPYPLTPPDTLQTETGKDIDRRTNTTVSRPGQFSSCSPNLWSSTTDGFQLSSSRQFRRPDVAQAFSVPSRHSCRLMRRHSWRGKPPSKKPAEPEDHPQAAVFCVSCWRRSQGSINRSKRRLYKHQRWNSRTQVGQASRPTNGSQAQ